MPRSRMLKPDYFRDEELCELPFEDRLLFAGLWTISDREGRIEYRLKRIKADIFPYDDLDIAACLNRLAAAKFIQIYEVDGDKYICVNNFKKHQHPHPKEPKSSIPSPTMAKQCPDNGEQLINNDAPLSGTSESESESESFNSESVAPSVPENENGVKSDEEWNAFRAAWAAFDKWSQAATRYPLRLGINLERGVWDLLAALANEPPIIHGGKQVAQKLLIPHAIEALIAEQCPWKNSASLKFACKCVLNKLDSWAKQGAPQTPKTFQPVIRTAAQRAAETAEQDRKAQEAIEADNKIRQVANARAGAK